MSQDTKCYQHLSVGLPSLNLSDIFYSRYLPSITSNWSNHCDVMAMVPDTILCSSPSNNYRHQLQSLLMTLFTGEFWAVFRERAGQTQDKSVVYHDIDTLNLIALLSTNLNPFVFQGRSTHSYTLGMFWALCCIDQIIVTSWWCFVRIPTAAININSNVADNVVYGCALGR